MKNGKPKPQKKKRFISSVSRTAVPCMYCMYFYLWNRLVNYRYHGEEIWIRHNSKYFQTQGQYVIDIYSIRIYGFLNYEYGTPICIAFSVDDQITTSVGISAEIYSIEDALGFLSSNLRPKLFHPKAIIVTFPSCIRFILYPTQ